MQNYLIKNIMVVNEGVSAVRDVLIKNGRIEQVDRTIEPKILVTEIVLRWMIV